MKTKLETVEVPAELLVNFEALLGEMSKMQGVIESLLLSKDKKFMAKLEKADEDIANGKVQDWDEFLSDVDGKLSSKEN